MVEFRKDGVMIDVCKICKGVWLDSGELERIIMSNQYSSDTHYPNHSHDYKHHKKNEFKHKHPVLYALKEIFD